MGGYESINCALPSRTHAATGELDMKSDEDQIRELVDTWMSATKAGDADTVLSLMTNDVVFLLPGREPMRKDEFASASKAQSGQSAPQIEGRSEIQEIKVSGDWAFMWSRLSVVITPADTSQRVERAGHTLTVLRKENGRWLLARDANLLTTVPTAEG
jgi:uncharacterized protein (TIGR02246 family)